MLRINIENGAIYDDYEKCKSYFTSGDSRIYIEFPYTPTIEYVESEAKDK